MSLEVGSSAVGEVADFFVAFFDGATGFGVGFLALFFAGDFFGGIGMVMPGMFIDCAVAGAATVSSAIALAAASRIIFTGCLRIEEGDAMRAPPSPFSYWPLWPE